MNDNIITNGELKDKSKNLIQKCSGKKKKNPKFSEYIKPFISKKSIKRIKECGDFLQMLSDLNLENSKIHKASFCGNRFCPMCAWRVAVKESYLISILMEYLRIEQKKDFIFLTLTVPNVPGDDLNNTIKQYNKAFKKLMERKEVKQIAKGYIRKLEVTYNSDKQSESFNTYHPHFHVVLAVNKTYFTNSKLYINHDRWLNLWRESTKNDTITQVDVRKAKLNDYNAIYELAKYSAKDTDYLISKSVFKTFYEALKGKQLIVYGGLFKMANIMLKNGELDKYKQADNIKYEYIINYNWLKNKYDKTKIRKLTDAEKEIINKE